VNLLVVPVELPLTEGFHSNKEGALTLVVVNLIGCIRPTAIRISIHVFIRDRPSHGAPAHLRISLPAYGSLEITFPET
jgi:hypothetical protein